MPIEGVTPDQALSKFESHVNDLLRRTITKDRLYRVGLDKGLHLSFRDARGEVKAAMLKSSKFGEIRWYFGHTCDAVETAPNRYRLRSARYAYKLYAGDAAEPFVRWEYVRETTPPGLTFPRHHLQGPMAITIGKKAVPLNKLHLPTGWITIEDVIRFCIHDLGVSARSRTWHRDLDESYHKFRTEFVGPHE